MKFGLAKQFLTIIADKLACMEVRQNFQKTVLIAFNVLSTHFF